MKRQEIFMSNDTSKVFSVTFPLKTEKWQEDILEKRFRIAGNLYNELMKSTRNRFLQMKQTKRYREAYLIEDIRERKQVYNDLLREYELSQFCFINEMTKLYKIYNKHIDSLTAQALARRVWRAHSTCLFSEGKVPRFKKSGSLNSISGMANRAGIHIRNNTLIWKGLRIPIVIKGTPYEEKAFENEIAYSIIIKKSSGYYVQIVFRGVPDQKNRTKGEGKVGIHMKVNRLFLSTEQGVKEIYLPSNNESYDKKIKQLNRALERSRREMNPENYNANGTIKKGRLTWQFSKEYKAKKKELARLNERKIANRKQQYTILANEILGMGNEFYLSKPEYKSIMKKPMPGKTSNEYIIKKITRKSIQNMSPFMFLQILETKLSFHDTALFKISNDDKKLAAYTCKNCGVVHTEENNDDAYWVCRECEEVNNKDINIATNMIR